MGGRGHRPRGRGVWGPARAVGWRARSVGAGAAWLACVWGVRGSSVGRRRARARGMGVCACVCLSNSMLTLPRGSKEAPNITPFCVQSAWYATGPPNHNVAHSCLLPKPRPQDMTTESMMMDFFVLRCFVEGYESPSKAKPGARAGVCAARRAWGSAREGWGGRGTRRAAKARRPHVRGARSGGGPCRAGRVCGRKFSKS